MKTSRIISRLEDMNIQVTNTRIGPMTRTDILHGKRMKGRVKLMFRIATEDELRRIERMPHVLKAKNIISNHDGHTYHSVAVYLDCKVSET